MAKRTTYGAHLTRGGLEVLRLCTESGAKERLARRLRGVRTKRSLSSGTLSLVLRGHRPIAKLAPQLAAKTGVAIEWFAERVVPPVEAVA